MVLVGGDVARAWLTEVLGDGWRGEVIPTGDVPSVTVFTRDKHG